MKFLFKMTLLATTIAFTANVSAAAATTDVVSINKNFENGDQQAAYALGISMARYMDNLLKEQEKLGIKLDKNQLISGVQDAFGGSNKSKLTDEEIEKSLGSFEARVKASAQAKMEQDAKENAEKGAKYRDAFAKEKGVKKTQTGLLYRVDKPGTGETPKDSDIVEVNYKGALIDGTEFDSSYTRGEPLSFPLNGVIPGWSEGIKHIKKGGKIKLVIPPELAYGKNGVPGISANSTLVFDVELLNVKAAPEAEAAAEKSTAVDGVKTKK